MSRTQKIILFVVLPVLALCVLICLASILIIPRLVTNAIATDPQAAKQIGSRIADYTLPRGYREAFGMDMFTAQWVMLAPATTPRGGGTVIMLMQFNTLTSGNYDSKQMEQQMQQTMQSQFGRSGAFQYAGEHNVTIKGQPTSLTIGESAQGSTAMRQATGVFQGKGGVVMLMVTGEASSWDWRTIEDFCASIR